MHACIELGRSNVGRDDGVTGDGYWLRTLGSIRSARRYLTASVIIIKGNCFAVRTVVLLPYHDPTL